MTEEDEDETYFSDFPPLFHYMRTLFGAVLKLFFARRDRNRETERAERARE